MKFISIVDPEKKKKKQAYFPKSFLEVIPAPKCVFHIPQNVLHFVNLEDFSHVHLQCNSAHNTF